MESIKVNFLRNTFLYILWKLQGGISCIWMVRLEEHGVYVNKSNIKFIPTCLQCEENCVVDISLGGGWLDGEVEFRTMQGQISFSI